MSKFTLYRADVDSPRLARVLGKVPGVAVAGDRETGAASAEPSEETTPSRAADESGDDGGFGERIPVPEADIVDEEQTSVVKTYGLLGLGVSMVVLGIATVGIWVYLRRKSDDGESETPPPARGLDTGETTPTPSGPATAETALSTGESEPSPSDRPMGQSDDEETEPRSRTEGDRADVEWSTRDTTPATEPVAEKADVPVSDEDEREGDEDEPRPTEPIDAAPLLGAAFLAVSGAVVKWLQSDAEESV